METAFTDFYVSAIHLTAPYRANKDLLFPPRWWNEIVVLVPYLAGTFRSRRRNDYRLTMLCYIAKLIIIVRPLWVLRLLMGSSVIRITAPRSAALKQGFTHAIFKSDLPTANEFQRLTVIRSNYKAFC